MTTSTPAHITTDPTKSANEAAFWAAHAEINAQVHTRLDEPARLVYCAYFESDDGQPEGNLDEIAVVGECLLIGPQDRPSLLLKWSSPRLANPTWGEVARLVNRMLIECDEQRFVHFEGLDWIEPYDAPVKRVAICLVD